MRTATSLKNRRHTGGDGSPNRPMKVTAAFGVRSLPAKRQIAEEALLATLVGVLQRHQAR